MTEHHPFLPHWSRQAMQHVVEADGVEPRRIDDNGLQDVGDISCRGVATQTPRTHLEALRVEIKQRQSRVRRRETTLVEKVARADANIKVAGGDMLVVEGQDVARRTPPNK